MKARTPFLEDELMALTGEGRDGRIVARHLGLDGNGGANFQRIGDELGLTRERVRQIVQVAGADRPSKIIDWPVLERTVAEIVSSLPAPASGVEERLCAGGFTSRSFRLEGIVNASRLLGRAAPFSIRALRTERFVLAVGFPDFNEILKTARRSVRRSGMASIYDLLRSGPDSLAARREMAVVEAVLVAQKGFRWLDQSRGWFWFSSVSGNVALRRIRKMLSVASSLTVADLRTGLARNKHALPPDEPLLEFCRQAPGITVEGDTITASSRIARARILNKTERDIFGILSRNNGRMRNSELICRANDLGIKRPTFYQCVSQSPIVSKSGRHYGLIGSKPPAPGLQFNRASVRIPENTIDHSRASA